MPLQNPASFKKWSMEVGEAIWGTVQGAFNERQTTAQIIVDAAIGMIPLVGDVTAARDLLAVSIRLIREPSRRTQVMEWVLLVILIFALVPVAGGLIKGVGRLLMRVGKDVAENYKLLEEIIQFLNRVGQGNAIQWLAKLDVLKYERELISRFKGFCEGISTTVNEIVKAQIGQLLPIELRNMLIGFGSGMLELRDLAVKYIPDALKELNNRLKVLQELVYKGDIHLLATGEKNLTREAEAHLLENEVRAAVKAGKWPQNLVMSGDEKEGELISSLFDRSKIAQGWPDLLRNRVKLPGHGEEEFYNSLCTFSGKIEAWGAHEFAGKTLYRAFGKAGKLAGESRAGGYFWGAGKIPANAEEWRKLSAVLDEWNANGLMVLITFPSADVLKKEPELEAALKGWFGSIAEQFGDKIKNQFLEGGGRQVGMGALPARLQTAIQQLGEAAKAGSGAGKAEVMGVKIEVKATGWTDVEGKYGYAASGEDLSQAAKTRKLDPDEIKSKLSNSGKVAAARVANQSNQ